MKAEEKDQTTEKGSESPVAEGGETSAKQPAEGETRQAEESSAGEKKELTVEELLDQSRREKEELYEKVLRAAADFENFRKRSIREKDELRKYATASLVEELLPALDNLERGLAAADSHPEAKPVSEGFRMVAQQIASILQNNGVECIDPLGETFDPHFHESLGFQPSEEVEDHKIVQVVRKGYMLNGRILRAASVIVSSGPAAEEGDS